MTTKCCWSFLIGLLFFCFWSLTFAQQQYDFVIRDYVTSIAVEENGDLQINEQISVNFTAPKHGIFRSIPYQYRNLSGNYITAPIIQTQVDGWDRESYKDGDNLIIKIGSPDVLVDGLQQYNINYTVRQWVRQYEGYQELYWNMMGPGREVPILSGSFIIGFPAWVDPSQAKRFVYYGDYGVRQTLDTVMVGSGAVSGYLPISLDPHQAVTIGIQFTDASFTLATSSLRWRDILLYVLYTTPFLIFVRCYRQRQRHGKDSPLPDVVSYYPPKGMTPPEYIVSLQWSCTASDIASLIYYRASQGILVIKQKQWDPIVKTNNLFDVAAGVVKKITWTQDIHYILHSSNNQKAKAAIKHMEEHERRLFDALFAGKQEVDVSTLDTLYPVLESISDQLTTQFSYEERYTLESRRAVRSFWYMVALLVVLYAILVMIVSWTYNTYLVFFANTNELLGWFILSYITSFVVTVVVCILFASIMYAKTPSYEQLLSSLRGYRTFIEKVEAPQLQVLLKQDPTFIDKTLPYAVVLGLASSFLKVTDQALGEAYHPVWFIWHGFHASSVAGLSTAIDTIATSWWVAPPASEWSWSWWGWFGSWGGGFSGGWGWGGWGGSW